MPLRILHEEEEGGGGGAAPSFPGYALGDDEDNNDTIREDETGISDTKSNDKNKISAFAKIAVINESDFDGRYKKDVHINPRLDTEQQVNVHTRLCEVQDIFSDVLGETT